MRNKQPFSLMWAGRFLDCKHPEKAVEVARRLKEDRIAFQLTMIGSGEMDESIRALIQQYDLTDHVFLPGSMTPEQVRKHMEFSQIFLFTSDFNEGWGAVLNEAMNSGCAVVASHAIGSVPYLIHHGQNGLIYQNENTEQLYQYTKHLLSDSGFAETLGLEAYNTITGCWNSGLAARRLYAFSQAKLTGTPMPVYRDGPMSCDNGKVKNYG